MYIARFEETEQYDKARWDLQFDVGDFQVKRTHSLTNAAREFANR